MQRLRTSGAAVALFLAGLAAAASAQPAPPEPMQGGGTVEASRNAAMQSYALMLRDAEARLRAVHERMAAGGTNLAQPPGSPSMQQELMDTAQAAWEAIRNAPPGFAATEAYKEADRRFSEGVERLRQGHPPPNEAADWAREMLQALAALREVAGAPAAPSGTGGPGGAPAEPAAQGGGRT